MSLDPSCIALVALAAVAGAFLGALSQLAQLGAMAAGWAGARVLGPTAASLLHGRLPAFAAHPLGNLLAFVVCAAVASVVLRAVLRLAAAGRAVRSGPDRGLGALLGAAQAALFLWAALSALAAWGRPLHLGPIDLDPTTSELVGLVREHGAFDAAAPAHGRAAPRHQR